jgi:AcrR family transcriptional regulator
MSEKAPKAGRSPQGKKRSTKELLFEAAMSLIGERGYGGASVDAIAAKAGVAKGIVYYYFDSKAALAEHLISSGLDFLADRLKRAAPDSLAPAKALEALAAEQLRQVEKRRDFAKFLLSEMWREDRREQRQYYADRQRQYDGQMEVLNRIAEQSYAIVHEKSVAIEHNSEIYQSMIESNERLAATVKSLVEGLKGG